MIIGFDWDGTLVERWTSTPLPNVRERLAALPSTARTFIATNQAGPTFRALLGDPKYPTVEDVAGRIMGGLAALDWWPDLLLIATHSGKAGEAWDRAAADANLDLRAVIIASAGKLRHWTIYCRPRYRKPQPGMLRDAFSFFRYDPHRVFIGDMDTDHQAAVAAGCRYLDATQWRAGAPL